jgi:hypothetical protein
MLSSGKQNTDNYIIKCHQAQESENASKQDGRKKCKIVQFYQIKNNLTPQYVSVK